MKKLTFTLALMLIAFTTNTQARFWRCAPYKLPTTTLTGDVNGDGVITIVDVSMLIAYILGDESFDFIADNADINDDGSITVSDVAGIVAIILYNPVKSCPDQNHPHMIDLGLPSGTLWACCNVGATAPEEYGGYFAWGETEEKEGYGWSTYSHCEGPNSAGYINITIGANIAGTQYDVAHVKWGGNWQMPTQEQMEELRQKCNWGWATINGKKVAKFFNSRNNAHIYLPAAGYKPNQNNKLFNYWTSNRHSSQGYRLSLMSHGPYVSGVDCCYGLSVRPVVKRPQ